MTRIFYFLSVFIRVNPWLKFHNKNRIPLEMTTHLLYNRILPLKQKIKKQEESK